MSLIVALPLTMNHEEPIITVADQITSSGTTTATTTSSSTSPLDQNFLTMPLWGGKQVDDDELSLFDDIHHQFSAINLIDNSKDDDNTKTKSIAQVKREEQESKMRREMTKLLEMCLRTQDNKNDMKPSKSRDSLRKLASMLEQRLYQSAISFESYCDLQTLESRMRVVLYQLRNQREQKKRQETSRISQKRSQVLQQIMGAQEYARAEWLIYEIHQRKTTLAGQSCGQCRQLPNGSLLCPLPLPRGGGRRKTTTQPLASFGEHLPTPVKNLFFRTPLLDVFGKYPVDRILKLPNHQLQRLMDQAERHMEEFDAWNI
ncbi:unnamed protein product [Cylindrotheca closterium]|uniref:Uncharacterized protein n=1 Tax=Cylindrotheca closterium TaxID=2856 RepID=A0AAD2G838_9STRA|nr:unnamed protein product [Cylindrotheca closterium]